MLGYVDAAMECTMMHRCRDLCTWKGSSVTLPSLSALMLKGRARSLYCIALSIFITVLVTT